MLYLPSRKERRAYQSLFRNKSNRGEEQLEDLILSMKGSPPSPCAGETRGLAEICHGPPTLVLATARFSR